MDAVFENTPYRLSAIIDLNSEPEAFTYSAHSLGAVLHNLHPPPQVFVVGAAISESMAKDAIGMWEEYIKNRGTEDTLAIEVSVRVVAVLKLCLNPCSFKQNWCRVGIGRPILWESWT